MSVINNFRSLTFTRDVRPPNHLTGLGLLKYHHHFSSKHQPHFDLVHSVTKPRVCLCPSRWVTLCLYLFLTHPRSLHNPLGAHPHHQDHLPSWASHEEHRHYSQGSRLATEYLNVAFPSFSHWHHLSSCPRALIRMLAWRRRLLMRSISASTGTRNSNGVCWRTLRQSSSVLFSPWWYDPLGLWGFLQTFYLICCLLFTFSLSDIGDRS